MKMRWRREISLQGRIREGYVDEASVSQITPNPEPTLGLKGKTG